MPTYQIHFRDGQGPEVVRADEMRHERNSIVFRTVQLVILTPCWVVQRRVAASEVAQVRQLDHRG
jgi:hypothetical protein